MKRILLFGSTGMVGNGVYAILKDKYHLILPVRNMKKIELLEEKYGGVTDHDVILFDAQNIYNDFYEKRGCPGRALSLFLDRVGEVDFVINVMGVIIPRVHKNEALTFFMNTAFPFVLSRIFGHRLIHLTTDCVFNGEKGFPYDEHSPASPRDLYGLTKSLGEPWKESLVLRTSTVGRELGTTDGLLEWFLSRDRGTDVKGFQDHVWNGITNLQFGKVCAAIIADRSTYPETGLYHIFSTTLSKYEMLLAFERKHQTGCTIIPYKEGTINRQLATVYDVNTLLSLPSFEEMLAEL